MTADVQHVKDAELHARQELVKANEQLVGLQKNKEIYQKQSESFQQHLGKLEAQIETLTTQLHERTVDLETANQTIQSLHEQKSRTAMQSGLSDSTVTPQATNSDVAASATRTQKTLHQLREEMKNRKQKSQQTRQQLSRANAELNLIQKDAKDS